MSAAPPPPKCYPFKILQWRKNSILNDKNLIFMVSVTGNLTKAAKIIGRDEVYVAAVALRATKGPAQLFMSTAFSLNLSWDLQHFMVIIKPSSSPLPNSQALVFDFQPQDPENVYVALAALSGRKIPGVVLTRKLKKLPKTKCWQVGYCSGIGAVNEFNEKWETDLIVGSHDCRHYTNGLVEYLTGEKYVLESLRKEASLT